MDTLYVELFFTFLIGHALCDYALQNDFIAQAKNHTTQLGKHYWHWVLPGHGLIHGGFVYIVTGSFILSLAETITHSVIDWLKCDNRISFNTDQLFHIGLKVLWVILIALEIPILMA